jgi:hypothetical protein
MRRLALLLALVAVAGCGGDDDERPASAAPDDPISSGPIDPDQPAAPAVSERACKRLGRRIVGAPLADATARAKARGCPLRVALLDGEPQALTEDFSPARINVRVEDDVVTGVEFMG